MSLAFRLRPLLSALFGLALLLDASTARAAPPLVVVLDIQGEARRLSRQDRRAVGEYLAAQMVQTGAYRAVPLERVRTKLAKEKRGTCAAWACQSEVAWAFKAQKVLVPKLSRLGRQCLLTATLYGVKAGVAERAASVRGGCRPAELATATEKLPQKLLAAPPTSVPVAGQADAKAPAKSGAKAPAKTVAKAPAKAPAKVAVADEPRDDPPPTPAAAAPARAVAAPKKTADTPRRGRPLWPALAAGGVAVVGLAVGIPLLALDGKAADCEGAPLPFDAHCKKLYDTKAPGAVFTSVGAAALVAGGVLYYLHYRSNKERPRRLQALGLSPASGGGLVLGASGQF